MLTQKTVGNNLYKMSGMTLSESGNTITIASGSLGDYSLEAMSFDLSPDTNLPVDYSLYLTLSGNALTPVLNRTILDGATLPLYDDLDKAIHRLVKLTLQPDNTYDGTFIQIIAESNADGSKITS